jgi:DNA-binding CsgD family transcriptional regulator
MPGFRQYHLQQQKRELTPRELQIAQLAAGGMPNAAIAAELGLAIPTVKNHIRSVFDKAGITRREDLLQWLQKHQTPRRKPLAISRPTVTGTPYTLSPSEWKWLTMYDPSWWGGVLV